MVPAPELLVTIDTWVQVDVPDEHTGNCSRLAFATVAPVIVKSEALVMVTRA